MGDATETLLARLAGGDTRTIDQRSLRVVALDTVLVLILLGATLLVARTWGVGPDSDVNFYAAYARAFWHGYPRFHIFPPEYPPLTVLIFSLALFPHGTATFRFEEWMGAVFFVGWALFYRMSGRRAAWRYAVLVLALQVLALARFDLIPGLLCVGALWAAQRRSWRLAFGLLAVATLLKVYPAFLVPLVLLQQGRASGQRKQSLVASAALWAGMVAVGFLGPFLLNPASLTSIVGYQSGRPVEVESVFGTIAWLGSLVGIPAQPIFAYTSFGFDGLLSAVLAPLSTPLLVFGVLGVYALAWRRRLPLARAFLLCLGVVILTDKVFSAQYMLWVLPIAAEAGDDFWLWLVAALLTLVEFPILVQYLWVDGQRWVFMGVVLARNVVFAIAVARTVWRSGRIDAAAKLLPLPWRSNARHGQSLSPVAGMGGVTAAHPGDDAAAPGGV